MLDAGLSNRWYRKYCSTALVVCGDGFGGGSGGDGICFGGQGGDVENQLAYLFGYQQPATHGTRTCSLLTRLSSGCYHKSPKQTTIIDFQVITVN